MRRQIGMPTESTENLVFRSPGLKADLSGIEFATVTALHTDIVFAKPKEKSHLEKYLVLEVDFFFNNGH